MLTDANKGITSVLYNHLNMPTKITLTGANAGVLDYTYSADGIKLQKKKTVGANVTITDYANDFVYENNTLKQFNQPEGYVEPDGSGWQYVYRLSDIWGNTRITFADDNNDGVITASSEIRREQNYYPGGLEHKGYNNVLTGVKNNLKTYQGQEFTEDLGLGVHEWKYRMSDPAILRFWQIDPLAEDYVYNSTYAFQENKLGLGIELEGLELGPAPWMQYSPAGRDAGITPTGWQKTHSVTTDEQAQALAPFVETGAGFIPFVGQGIDAKDTYNAFFNGGDGWAKAFALAAWIPGLDFLKSGRKVLKGATKVDAAAINKIFGQAPYDEAFDVIEGFTKQGETFVRVHGESNKVSKWMMKFSEIEGLSPKQIQDKFALPELPTHISNVNVPARTNVRVGVARKVDGWGNGGGQQVELLQRLSEDAFTNTRKLE